MKPYLLPIVLCVLLLNSACNPSTRIQVLQPAAFAVPEHIKTVATINRSVPRETLGSIVEGALTGEGIYQDRDGAMRALTGLTEALTRTPRFSVKSSGIEFEGGGIHGMPPPIAWQEIERLCTTYNADAVAALEMYDTDIRTDFITHEKKNTPKTTTTTATTNTTTTNNNSSGTRPNTQTTGGTRPNTASSSTTTTNTSSTTNSSNNTNSTNKNDTNQSDRGSTTASSTIEYEATMYSSVKMGWRLYDPKNRRIIDEFTVSEDKKWNERAATKDAVLRELPTPREAVNVVSQNAGAKYGSRIAPTWASVERDYYKKGGDQMERAYRLTRTAKWKEAAAIWQPLTKSPDQKLASMACYNMAIACEVEGQLQSAREWAMQAYEQHNNKRGRTYANLLSQRIETQRRVNEQMKGSGR